MSDNDGNTGGSGSTGSTGNSGNGALLEKLAGCSHSSDEAAVRETSVYGWLARSRLPECLLYARTLPLKHNFDLSNGDHTAAAKERLQFHVCDLVQ